MSGHRWLIAETYAGPVSVNVDGVHFTAHSMELRRVPEKLDGIRTPPVDEYEIVLRIRPDDGPQHIKARLYDMDVFLNAQRPKIGADQ